MGKFWRITREYFLMLAMTAIVVLGVVGGAGSLNYGVRHGGGVLYIIAGIVAIADAVLYGIEFHNRYLKPKS